MIQGLMIQGKVENIFDNEDFARMLDEKLGYDAAQYFRDETDPEVLADGLYQLSDSEILKKGYCSGECDKVQQTQEHYENLLKEVRNLAHDIYEKILEGYQIGGRRTKKEQVAIDKAIEIMRVVDKNT